jgi:lactate permease
MPLLPLLLSVSPFALFIFLLLWKKMPLLKISLLIFALILIFAVFYWKILPIFIAISLIKGFFVALDIFIIIFGAIFFLEILKSIKIIENICYYLEIFSKDYRIQIILLAWFLENFLEGTAGFGTPGAIVAPILVGLGLTPLNAVIVSLLGNSTAGVFGAAGTPIRVGLGSLATPSLAFYAAAINCVGFLVPVFMLWFITKDRQKKSVEFFEALPFAIWSGIAFVVPSLVTVFLGQEFPSILGAAAGIALIFLTVKFKIFMPKTVIDPHPTPKPTKIIPPVKVVLPYLAFVVFLALGKILFGSAKITVGLGINHTISLFNPGLVFLIVGLLITNFWKDNNIVRPFSALGSAAKRSLEPFLVIITMSAMVQIMTSSQNNTSGLLSMIEYLAIGVKSTLLPLWAPLIGTFGSFVTGSVTISNIMFGGFLKIASIETGFNVDKILALGVVGAAAGNMIALADILSAETVVGIKNEEGKVVKAVAIPCLIYVLTVGAIGLIIAA